MDTPTPAQQQWMQKEFAAMLVYTPYFDSRTSWFPNGYAYKDSYAIYPASQVRWDHPEWILHDQYGNWLYIPYACGGGTCSQYAADIANPAYRAWWISDLKATMAQGNYQRVFVDDVNMNFMVGNGSGNLVAPMDSTTGQVMTWDAWRSYFATFMEELRAALPYTNIMHNSVWSAGPAGVLDADPSIRRQIAAATVINLERGLADAGLTGGTGQWSVNSVFNYVDRIHAAGKGINYQQEGTISPAQQQYGLAGYFMTSNGMDFVGDETATPNNWFNGYDVNLGTPLGPRTYSNGVFQRNFSGGIALLAEPGLAAQIIQLGASFQTLSGATVSFVSLSGGQGAVLTGSTNGTQTSPVPPATRRHHMGDLTPTYSVNGWGPVQINRSTDGNPLTLNGVTYRHGLGVHAFSELKYSLAALGGCSSFTAAVGIDNEIPAGYGSVDFQVWADGFLIYDSGFLVGGGPVGTVNLNLTGRQELSLVATNGIYMAPSWTVYDDHSDWARPVLSCVN
jgi:hypothetical protein